MRRAVVALIVLIAVSTSSATGFAQGTASIVDGAGMVDYSREPNFQVGSWVKYHVLGSSLKGHQDDYTVTVLIAGEENFWGDPSFWVETWTEKKGRPARFTASLMSYSAFGDTMASQQIMWFLRKTIDSIDEHGKPEQAIARRESGELKLRAVNWQKDRETNVGHFDTLGTDTTIAPTGTFKTLRVKETKGRAETVDTGDSTTFYQRVEEQIFHYSREVPITSLVRTDIDHLQRGKSWMIGQFNKDSPRILERAQGRSVLVGFGTELEPKIVPVEFRRSLGLQNASRRPAGPKPSGTNGSTRKPG